MLTRRDVREQRVLSTDQDAIDDARAAAALDDSVDSDAIDRFDAAAAHGDAPTSDDPDDGIVRILVVCTGNVIRSALAERALRQQFALIGADRFHVSSAGTRAAVGQGMWRESVEIARAYGFDYRDFVSRQLDDEVLRGVDYVIVAAREHRESVLRRRPDLLHRTFTFRELVRILDDAGPTITRLAAADAADRWTDIASWADRNRVSHRAADPVDDDLVDPRNGSREELWTFERDLIRGVVTIVSAVAGEHP